MRPSAPGCELSCGLVRQQSGDDGGVRTLDVAGRGHECQAAEHPVSAQALECRGVPGIVEFVRVPECELGEALWVMTEPGPK